MRRIYETDRLLLRVLDKGAAEMVLDYYTRNQVFLSEWEPKREEDFYTKEGQEENLDTMASQMEMGSALYLWAFKKEDSGRLIGCVGFSNMIRGPFLSCFLGYKLDKDEINKGYVTEAVQKGIDVVFYEWGLHRIEANIMPKNRRSLRVVEKLGFYNEGTAVKYLKINDKWEDHIHMVLLNAQV